MRLVSPLRPAVPKTQRTNLETVEGALAGAAVTPQNYAFQTVRRKTADTANKLNFRKTAGSIYGVWALSRDGDRLLWRLRKVALS
jgi:hypothetical protein